jgi:hypothetical protein
VKNAERHFTGRYTDKACTAPATELQEEEGKANKYEWLPGVVPANAQLKAKHKAYVELGSGAGGIECRKYSLRGEWTGPRSDTEVLTFEGCELNPSWECHSAGQARGTIVSDPLAAPPGKASARASREPRSR